jgi:hypothetical protein
MEYELKKMFLESANLIETKLHRTNYFSTCTFLTLIRHSRWPPIQWKCKIYNYNKSFPLKSLNLGNLVGMHHRWSSTKCLSFFCVNWKCNMAGTAGCCFNMGPFGKINKKLFHRNYNLDWSQTIHIYDH